MTIWITRIDLNNRERRLPFDADQTHRFLTLASNSSTYLWAHPRAGLLIAQSEGPLNGETIKRVSSSVFAAPRQIDYKKGERLIFSGILNPTKTEIRPGRHGKRVPLPHDQMPDWLMRRLGNAAQVDQLEVQQMPPALGIRPGGQRMTHNRAAFSGTLTVQDPEVLAGLLVGGVGRAKRFGCGLLLTEVMK